MKSIAVYILLCFIQLTSIAQFVDVTTMLGQNIVLDGLGLGSGISFYDINGDGWDDLTIGNGHGDIAIFINNEGQLEPAPFTIPNNNNLYVVGVLWGDLDNDGDPDLLILKNFGPVELWMNNGDNTFSEIASNAGIAYGELRFMGASFVDYDHDGLLDIYITTYHYPVEGGYQIASRLFRNTGDLSFEDATLSSEIYVPPCPAFQAAFADFDGDGWEDMYLVVDRDDFENVLFKNDGDGTFTNVSFNSGANGAFCAMSTTVGDYDNDRDLDIYVTGDVNTGNELYRYEENFFFNRLASDYSLGIFETGWGAMWLDFDNDGWLDLFVSAITGMPEVSNNLFFKNSNGVSFEDVSSILGINAYTNETWVCAMGDINNDGFYDFAVNNRPPFTARLYQNTPNEKNYVSISLKGTISNLDGIGTWIHCYTPQTVYSKFTLCGENLYAQNSSKMIFGLRTENIIDSVVVEWNSGTTETYTLLQTNAHHQLIEGNSFIGTCMLENLSENSFICPGDTITLSAGIYNNYLWSTGDTTSSISISNPGLYFATVTNQYGIQILSDTIGIDWAPITEIDEQISHVSCFGLQDGSIELSFPNGEPQYLMWGNNVQNLINDSLFSGIYSFIAIDIFGCEISGSYEIVEPQPLNANMTIENVSCFNLTDGSAIITPSGGTFPYFVNCINCNLNKLAAGYYDVLITDTNGCTTNVYIEISQPDNLEIELTLNPQISSSQLGSALADISGGTQPYSLVWSNGIQDEYSIYNLIAGSFSLSVEDFNGCTTEVLFEIQSLTGINSAQHHERKLFPNPVNDFLTIGFIEQLPFSLRIYDSVGKICLENHSISEIANINLSFLDPGVYLVEIKSQNLTSQHRLIKQ
jgi:hypothetical protein